MMKLETLADILNNESARLRLIKQALVMSYARNCEPVTFSEGSTSITVQYGVTHLEIQEEQDRALQLIFAIGILLGTCLRAGILLVLAGCSVEGINHSSDVSGPRKGGGSDAGVFVADTSLKNTDTSADSQEVVDLALADLQVDLKPDLKTDSVLLADLRVDVAPVDLSPDVVRKNLGSPCSSGDQCANGYCTDNVCCVVAKCIDTCVPSGGSTCPTYNGFTCAPLGTCRAY